jgi:hypothetical protein
MGSRFANPDSLDRFVSEVRQQLDASGFAAAASHLASVQGTAFTSGSEWLGELGAAVNAIRNDGKLPLEIREKLEVIRAEVRRVWPAL